MVSVVVLEDLSHCLLVSESWRRGRTLSCGPVNAPVEARASIRSNDAQLHKPYSFRVAFQCVGRFVLNGFDNKTRLLITIRRQT